MKNRFFHSLFQTAIRTLLRILPGITVSARIVFSGLLQLRCGARFFGRALVPLIFFLYCKARQTRARTLAVLLPLKGRSLYILGHRYFIHILIIILSSFAFVPALSAANTPPSAFGSKMLLRQITPAPEEEELFVDDTLAPEQFDSILEALFQNQQIPSAATEAPLPLMLEGDILARQEIPGTLVPVSRAGIVQYGVQAGDTVWGIAEQFGVSVATVLWENNLSIWSTIRPGQTLNILPVSGITHTVRKGDTLGAIAKKYRAALDEVEQYNGAEAVATLTPGAKIIIPGGRPIVTAVPAPRREVVQAPPPVAATPVPSGKLLWPTISTRITQYFRWRHTGLDIGDKMGNPIYAVENGTVEQAGWGAGGWGNMVLVDHGNGIKTRYAHASKVLVEAGQQVQKGQAIALVGSTGRSTGPHLHLGIYVNGRAVNPLEYLR